MFLLAQVPFCFPFWRQILTPPPTPHPHPPSPPFWEFKSQEVGHSQLHIDSIDVLGILSQNVNYRLQCSLSTLKAKCICPRKYSWSPWGPKMYRGSFILLQNYNLKKINSCWISWVGYKGRGRLSSKSVPVGGAQGHSHPLSLRTCELPPRHFYCAFLWGFCWQARPFLCISTIRIGDCSAACGL